MSHGLHPLERRVQAVARRARRLTMLYGFGWFVALVLLAGGAAGAVDFFVRVQDQGVRLILTFLVLVAAAWAFRRYLLPTLLYRRTPVQVAERIERQYPELRDRLSNAIAFLREPDDDPRAGSAELRRAVIADATARSEGVNFMGCLDPKRPRQIALVAVLLTVGIGVLCTASGSAALAARRLLMPWSAHAWPRWNDLRFVEAPRRLARGQDFEVTVIDRRHRLPEDVQLHYRYDGEQEIRAAAMKPHGKTMALRLPNVTRSFVYRAVGGDDHRMPWIRLEVEDPPTLEQLSIQLVPPEYTGHPVRSSDRHLRALVGTRVALEGQASRKLTQALLVVQTEKGTNERPLELVDGGRGFRLRADEPENWVVANSGHYQLVLTDLDDIQGGTEERWELRAIVDQAPTVSLQTPAGNRSATRSAVIPLEVQVKDDLAIQEVVLRYRLNQGDEQTVSLAQFAREAATSSPGDVEIPFWQRSDTRTVSWSWDLSQLEALQPGSGLEFYVAASDFKPQEGRSAARRITVLTADELEERLGQRQSQLLAQLGEILRIQREARQQTGALLTQLEEVQQFTTRDIDQLQSVELQQRQVLRLLAESSESVVVQIRQLLAEMDHNRLSGGGMRDRLEKMLGVAERLARDPLPQIQTQLVQTLKIIRAAPDQPPAETAELLAGAGRGQDTVIAELEAMLGELSQWDSYRRFAREVHRIQQDQAQIQQTTEQLRAEYLTKDLHQLSPQQRARLRQLSQQQAELARRLDRLMGLMQQSQEMLRSTEPEVARTLSEALAVLQRQAVSGLMRQSSNRLDQNQLGQASTHQQDAASGLAQVMDVLAHREQPSTEDSLQQLSQLAERLEQLRREQQQLNEALQATNRDSDRQLAQLTRRQEELQRQAEEAAAQLQNQQASQAAQAASRAAAKMQQAGQSLAQQDAAAASSQGQQAGQELARAQQQLQQQLQQAEMALLRERMLRLQNQLTGLQARQKTVLQQTEDLQRLREEQGGTLSDPQRLTVQDLAQQEQLLAAETGGLAEGLGSTPAFRFALELTMREMRDAAGQLERQETGPPAQQKLRTALAQLEQLLAAFEQGEPSEEGNEPSPSGTSPKPPESQPPPDVQILAELKLLKALQQQVRDRTEQIESLRSERSELDESLQDELEQLADRQGQLAEIAARYVRARDEANRSSNDALPELPRGTEIEQDLDRALLPQ